MTRYLCCLAVLGVGALPDWATAYHPCWVPPPCGPAPAYPPQFYLVPPAAPVYEVPLPPPTVHVVPAPKAAAPAPTPPAARTDAPPVRPATAATPPAPLPPAVVPKTVPKAVAPKAEPRATVPDLGPKTELPKAPDLKLPTDTPKGDAIPPLVLPDPPAAPPAKTRGDAAPTAPSLVPPPDVPVRSAVPTPAPAPDADPKRNADAIPPLVLPPDGPGGSSGVIPPTTARSSPLAAAPRLEVFAVAGQAAGALRRVGFFNHTDRAIPLTIEGRAVTLPAKSFLHAELPPTFRWSEAGGPPRRTTVPADSAGVDVLFRAGD